MSKYGQMATNVKEIVKLALLVALLAFVVAFLKFVSILPAHHILARSACLFRFYARQQLYSHFLRPGWYIRRIPGPKHHSWAYGHVRMVSENSPAAIHQKWFKEYGPVVRFQGFFGVNRSGALDSAQVTD